MSQPTEGDVTCTTVVGSKTCNLSWADDPLIYEYIALRSAPLGDTWGYGYSVVRTTSCSSGTCTKAIATAGTMGTYTVGNPFVMTNHNSEFYASTLSLTNPTTYIDQFGVGTNGIAFPAVTGDTFLSRGAAGVVNVGATSGNADGNIKAAKFNVGGTAFIYPFQVDADGVGIAQLNSSHNARVYTQIDGSDNGVVHVATTLGAETTIQGGDCGITYGGVQHCSKTVDLTAANIAALGAGVQILAAPAAGYINVLDTLIFDYVYATAAFTTTSSICYAKYASVRGTVNASGQASGNFSDQAFTNAVDSTWAVDANIGNAYANYAGTAAIQLICPGGITNPGTAAGTLHVRITYLVYQIGA